MLTATDEKTSKICPSRQTVPSQVLKDRPSITEVVSKRVALKKAGKESAACCPFHADKTPSFYVNEAKGYFYCHSCHVGGDVIKFVELIDGVSFKEAIARLGLAETGYRRSPKPMLFEKAATAIAQWRRRTSDRTTARLREIGRRSTTLRKALPFVDPARQSELKVLQREWQREWEILSDVHDDLWNSPVELWKERKTLEIILGPEVADSTEDPGLVFPPLTEEYGARLRAYVRLEEGEDECERQSRNCAGK